MIFRLDSSSPSRYIILRRNIAILMIVITVLPLSIMAVINHFQYQSSLENEIIGPMRVLVNKTKHSFQLTLEERFSTVRFIASAYTFEDLSDEKTLTRIFRVIRKEFGGFVDLGLINNKGVQVSYAGPYSLLGKNYSDQSWFQEALIRDAYISDVFMGYRQIPHIAIAVRSLPEEGNSWILRATLDTNRFDNLIASMGLAPESDAFLINHEGIFQTSSRYYGKVLEKYPFPVPPETYESHVIKETAPDAREVLIAYAYFENPDYVLVVVKPRSLVLQTWFTLQSEMFFVFFTSVIIIIMIVVKLSDVLVINIQRADKSRESAIRELEQHHKLSSIGRLAAGVAHEINNPLAIINQKAGLMKDLIELGTDFEEKGKFIGLTDSVIKSVDRCKTITHRLLGFARRMDVNFEELDLNELLKEVLGFLEKEILYRNIKLDFRFAENIPQISSDRGQLQQVFLNILTNALAAVEDGGRIILSTWEDAQDTMGVSCQDNGAGMSRETLERIFDPFFTTKIGQGTGLGLSISYGIVKKLGGDIKVQSSVGEGATFTVYLPKKTSGESKSQ